MSDERRLSLRRRTSWIAALIVVPLVSTGVIFGLTDDGIIEHENSQIARQYTELDQHAAAQPETPAAIEFPTRYGTPGGATALVVYDDQSDISNNAELYAIAAANLATHFGEVQIRTLSAYASGEMTAYDAAIYIGVDYRTRLPQHFLDDVRGQTVPVLWLGEGTRELANGLSPDGREFVAQYGWDPSEPVSVPAEQVRQIGYNGQSLNRVPTFINALTPNIVDPNLVEVLATGFCRDARGEAMACVLDEPDRGSEVPWALRSGNLTHLYDIPLKFIDWSEDYLMLADLYYDLLGPDIEPVRQAAVRFEDVGPEANPEDLRRVTDYLASKGIPFQVAVVPVAIARTPDGDDWYGLTLLDAPEVVAALKYMQQHGGTLIQHGTTHQYGDAQNPYSGRSGEDYEFYRYGCSGTESPPYEWEECKVDSWVRKIGPVPLDSVEDHRERLLHGKQIMIDAGLGEPTIFETPHYTASASAYLAMAEVYDARYEQVEYHSGMLSGNIDSDHSYGQIFPYSVHDIYGSKVYPENLQNVTRAEQNNHAIRTPSTIVNRARANLVVRESTASFYFHPFLSSKFLDEVVEGILELDYEFVPVDELR